jgi:hypothetical protein
VPKKSVIGVRDERERERKKPQEKTSHELRRQRKGRNYCDKWEKERKKVKTGGSTALYTEKKMHLGEKRS